MKNRLTKNYFCKFVNTKRVWKVGNLLPGFGKKYMTALNDSKSQPF